MLIDNRPLKLLLPHKILDSKSGRKSFTATKAKQDDEGDLDSFQFNYRVPLTEPNVITQLKALSLATTAQDEGTQSIVLNHHWSSEQVEQKLVGLLGFAMQHLVDLGEKERHRQYELLRRDKTKLVYYQAKEINGSALYNANGAQKKSWENYGVYLDLANDSGNLSSICARVVHEFKILASARKCTRGKLVGNSHSQVRVLNLESKTCKYLQKLTKTRKFFTTCKYLKSESINFRKPILAEYLRNLFVPQLWIKTIGADNDGCTLPAKGKASSNDSDPQLPNFPVPLGILVMIATLILFLLVTKVPNFCFTQVNVGGAQADPIELDDENDGAEKDVDDEYVPENRQSLPLPQVVPVNAWDFTYPV
ncbi:hypothetical protein K435DRAFT_797802 [Dendrothele bispora CBS 962.96]|uniref:Uncharacterized protein n=1 Tax=Dendrothele bispora (strain CBS 962.96) TaxID=1314807 RepID=A0A4V4HFQ7_DENBC|nr:hypothetical protein K435DRAFT_797802 [Dendrothele bispora CBS 962.96]